MSQPLTKALRSLRPNASFIVRGGVLESYEDEQAVPSDVEISAELERLETLVPLNNLRTKRNRLLAETDYLALSDVTMSDEMRTYRQALRDLPANTSDPANPTWPVKPGG